MNETNFFSLIFLSMRTEVRHDRGSGSSNVENIQEEGGFVRGEGEHRTGEREGRAIGG